ncbi:hypothetical protein GCM10027421_37470 [Microbacterium shaanxiense]
MLRSTALILDMARMSVASREGSGDEAFIWSRSYARAGWIDQKPEVTRTDVQKRPQRHARDGAEICRVPGSHVSYYLFAPQG